MRRGFARLVLLTAIGCELLAAAPAARAQSVPQTITFTARLEDAGGPLEGAHDLDFALRVATPPFAVAWSESHAGVAVSDGLVDLRLGATTPFASLFTTAMPLELEVTVDGVALSPRVPLASVPFAIEAGDAHLLEGQPASAFWKLGSALACPPGAVMVGVDAATGNVQCGVDQDTTYGAGAGLQLIGSVFSIVSGGVTSAMLAASSVDSSKILDGTVASVDIKDGTITSVDVADGSLTGVDIQDGTIQSIDIFDGTITSTDILDGTITGTDIANGTVASADILDSSLTGTDIQDGTIAGADLAVSAVGMRELSAPMGQGHASLAGAPGDVDSLIYPALANIGTVTSSGRCLVTATGTAVSAEEIFVWVTMKENGTDVLNADSMGFATNPTFSSFQLVNATASAVVSVTAGKSYQLGCRISPIGGGSIDLDCNVTYFCQ